MLVQDKVLDDPTIEGDCTLWEKLLSKGRHHIERVLVSLQDTTNPSYHSLNVLPSGKVDDINQSDADVVNLHWVNNGMLSIAEIGRIQKPTVWTLHDAWPFCGAEHYSKIEGGLRHREGYRADNKGKDHDCLDLDRWTWNRKRRHWKCFPTTLAAPSEWMAKEAKSSRLFSPQPVSVIPNAINTNVYQPHDLRFARDVLGLPNDELLVVFGSVKPTSDSRKGFTLLKKALQQVNKSLSGISLGIFGAGHGPGSTVFGCPTHYLGYLHDDSTLSLVYSAADVVVVPSKLESFGLTAAEALACGTPVVCFRTSGLTSVVDHGKTGYLADPFNPEDLAKGIKWVLTHKSENSLPETARKTAVAQFSFEVVSKMYHKLYRETIDIFENSNSINRV
jgi:glycosyltransferase involved in cell wall biosynthesis